jgi:hypothetical protein
VFEDDTKYRLIEDRRGHMIRDVLVPDVVPGHAPHRKDIPFPMQQLCWSRYGNDFWKSFSPNGVIASSLESPEMQPAFGPTTSVTTSLRVAYDALNLGVMDLRTRGVTWDGLRFVCASNEFGRGMDGELLVDAENKPESLKYEISEGRRRFQYEVRYEFARESRLPEFFPSRIRIEFVDGSVRKLTSEYEIFRLQFSDRQLKREDVAFVATGITNLVNYIYTNGSVYRVTNSDGVQQLTRLAAKTEIAGPSGTEQGYKRVVVAAVIGLATMAGGFHLVKLSKLRTKGTQ